MRSTLRMTELRRSLKTDNIESAKALAAHWNQQIEKAFLVIRLSLPSESQKPILEPVARKRKNKNIPENVVMASALFLKFHQEMVDTQRWGEKTQFENQTCFALFLKIAGDKPVTDYSHRQLLDFRDKLVKLPPNINVKRLTKGKSIDELLVMKHQKLLSRVRVNRHLIVVTAFFRWLLRHEVINRSPAHNIILPKAKIRTDEERERYFVDEIRAIIKGVERYRHTNPERFWVPMIAIYSGMRLNEICQLYIADIKDVDSIWCIDINEDKDKQLKNMASRRVIPIHPELLKLGILKYADDTFKKGQERLFPALKKHKKNGYAHQIGQWFRLFNREKITDNPRKTFHSLRHAFIDELKQKCVSTAIIVAIIGHSSGSITLERYGKRFSSQILLEAVKQIDYS